MALHGRSERGVGTRPPSEGPELTAVLIAFVQDEAAKVASRAARRGSVPANEVENITQDLVTEVVKEWHRYDPARSAEAFATRIIGTRYISILRKRRALKHGGRRRPPLCIDHPQCQEPIGPGTLSPIQRADLRHDLDIVRRKLPSDLLPIFDALRVDPCPANVARRLGLEGRAMRTALERLRKHCFEEGLLDYL